MSPLEITRICLFLDQFLEFFSPFFQVKGLLFEMYSTDLKFKDIATLHREGNYNYGICFSFTEFNSTFVNVL